MLRYERSGAIVKHGSDGWGTVADIKPFRGIFYNSDKVNLADVVAPPYDVISPEQRDQLYAASSYNAVRLILGREEDRYSSAARYYGEWRKERILIKDEMPSIY